MSLSKKSTLQDRVVNALKEKGILLPMAFFVVLLIDLVILYGIIQSPQNFCLGVVGIGIITPFAFIWFRIRKPKILFALITAVFLVVAPMFSVMAAEYIYSAEPRLFSDSDAMKDGKIDPYTWNGETRIFNFTVLASSEYLNISHYNDTVYLNLSDPNGNVSNYTMSATGSMDDGYIEFYRPVELEKGVYSFYFSIKKSNNTSTEWVYTLWSYGPLNLEKSEHILSTMPYAFLATFMYFGFLSYIITGMYWWTQIAKKKKKEMVTVRKDAVHNGEGLKCPVCGNGISEDVETCPYCGAELEYEENEEDNGTADSDESAE